MYMYRVQCSASCFCSNGIVLVVPYRACLIIFPKTKYINKVKTTAPTTTQLQQLVRIRSYEQYKYIYIKYKGVLEHFCPYEAYCVGHE